MFLQPYQTRPEYVSAVQWDGTLEHGQAIQRKLVELGLDRTVLYQENLSNGYPVLDIRHEGVLYPQEWLVIKRETDPDGLRVLLLTNDTFVSHYIRAPATTGIGGVSIINL